MSDGIFHRRTAAVLVTATAATLAVTLFYVVFPDVPDEILSIGGDSFSVSALGYQALVELLRADVQVLVSRQSSAHKARPETPLLVLEPSGRAGEIDRFRRLIELARKRWVTSVVVLPKWRGSPMAQRSEWVGSVRLLPAEEPRRVLAVALGRDRLDDGAIFRGRRGFAARPEAWHGELADLGGVPEIDRSPQLMKPDPELSAVLESESGVLVARSPDGLVWVVSDPDVLNTAGLARGDNPVLAQALLVGMLEPESLVVDEVVHGYGQERDLWRALIRFPLICVTLHLLALAALAVWATTGRFGRPLPAPSRLPPGKLTLLDNTARLLSLGGDVKRSLTHYLELTVRPAARRWNAGSGGLKQRVERLSALGRGRGVSEDLEQLATRIMRWPANKMEPRRALALARALHRWRKEMSPGRGPAKS